MRAAELFLASTQGQRPPPARRAKLAKKPTAMESERKEQAGVVNECTRAASGGGEPAALLFAQPGAPRSPGDCSSDSKQSKAKRRHNSGAKAGRSCMEKSRRRPALLSLAGRKKSPDRPPLPHHKVRVQDAKLDRLDALHGRRRIREAVHRRHDDGERRESGFCRRLSFSSLCCLSCPVLL